MILVKEGQSPLILCLPHSGTDLPPAVGARLNATGRLQADLAWRLERVLDFPAGLDATIVRSSVSRYVIDLDKDPTTPLSAAWDPAHALCPVTTLDRKRIYQEGEEPGPTEVEQRMLLFFRPFHLALRNQIDRVRRLHNKVVVLDCQSMRSQIRGVTDSGLPLVNIGSGEGTTTDPDLRNLIVGSFHAHEGLTVGVDGFAKGGFVTRSVGRPDQGVHAMTLLLAQRSYLRHESPPFEPDKARMGRLKSVLLDTFGRLNDWADMQGGTATLPAPVASPAPVLPVEPAPVDQAEPIPGPELAIGNQDESREPVEVDDGLQEKECERRKQPAVVPLDTASLTRVQHSRTGKVEEEPVTPLLVAE